MKDKAKMKQAMLDVADVFNTHIFTQQEGIYVMGRMLNLTVGMMVDQGTPKEEAAPFLLATFFNGFNGDDIDSGVTILSKDEAVAFMERGGEDAPTTH